MGRTSLKLYIYYLNKNLGMTFKGLGSIAVVLSSRQERDRDLQRVFGEFSMKWADIQVLL